MQEDAEMQYYYAEGPWFGTLFRLQSDTSGAGVHRSDLYCGLIGRAGRREAHGQSTDILLT
jgi:hypothetical protein